MLYKQDGKKDGLPSYSLLSGWRALGFNSSFVGKVLVSHRVLKLVQEEGSPELIGEGRRRLGACGPWC